MESTITQNGALYALQHGAPKKYRRLRPRRMGANLIRIVPTLTTSMEKFTTRPSPVGKAQFAPQNNRAQVADAFSEYRAAA
jgi:hypothetical protein